MKRVKKGLTLWVMGGVGVIILICLFVAIRALYSTSEGFADAHPEATKQLIANLKTLNSSATQYENIVKENTTKMNNLHTLAVNNTTDNKLNIYISEQSDLIRTNAIRAINSAKPLLTKLDGYLIRNWGNSIVSSNPEAQKLVSRIKEKVTNLNNALPTLNTQYDMVKKAVAN